MASYYPRIVSVLNADEPVTVTEVRSHSRVDFGNDDTDLQFWITTAREMLENTLSRAIRKMQLRTFLDSFPYTDPIELPWPPLISVESLTWIDSSLTTTVWTANGLDLLEGSPGTIKAHIDIENEPGRLVPPYGLFQWPPTILKTVNGVQIDYTAGYEDADSTPSRLKQAIRLIVGHWYQNREAVVLGKAVAVDSKQLQIGVDAVCAELRLAANF